MLEKLNGNESLTWDFVERKYWDLNAAIVKKRLESSKETFQISRTFDFIKYSKEIFTYEDLEMFYEDIMNQLNKQNLSI